MIAIEVVDRRRPRHGQVRLDRMFEPLGVAVIGRVPDAIEHRPGQLSLKDRVLAVQVVVDDRRLVGTGSVVNGSRLRE